MSIEITVRGSFAAFQPPERGTVHATLAFEGPAMEPVYEQVVRDLEAVKASIAPLHAPDHGPVSRWSTQHVHTWSSRPWNQDGKQLPLVHHASVGVEVKFRDFAELSCWVGEHVTGTEGFRLSRVVWPLTTKRREKLLKQVRTRAVQDAVRRAQQYADALGLGHVRPVAIADAGMLGRRQPERNLERGYLDAAPIAGKASVVELVPAEIEVSAAVDARFLVGKA